MAASINNSMGLGNVPNNVIMKYLDEAIELNKDPKVAEKLLKCKFMNESLDQYLEKTCSEPSPLLKKIISETYTEPWDEVHKKGLTSGVLHPLGMSGAYEGQFLKMMAEVTKAERILDIGMYTGCSAISFCESKYSKEVISLEFEPYMETFVKSRSKGTPADAKHKVMVGKALDNLEELKSEGKPFDLVFIDADKTNYPNYYKFIMNNGLLSPGGIILVDNALFFGSVYPTPSSEAGAAIAEMNELARADDRVEQVLLPIRDGILFVRSKV